MNAACEGADLQFPTTADAYRRLDTMPKRESSQKDSRKTS
jgi:hypothetical protein